MLLQGADFLTGRKIADEPLPPAKSLLAQPKVHQHEPLQFTIPENTAGQAKRKGRSKAAAALDTPAEEVEVVTAVEGTPIETTSGPHLQQETCFVSIAPKMLCYQRCQYILAQNNKLVAQEKRKVGIRGK